MFEVTIDWDNNIYTMLEVFVFYILKITRFKEALRLFKGAR